MANGKNDNNASDKGNHKSNDKGKQPRMKKSIDGNELLKELIMKQLKNVSQDKKLQYTDLKRICKYINSSIFDENKCCYWNGYVTNANNSNKGTYVNFYFRKKKAALHRLLYCNFIGDLSDDEYLKFSCENKGNCCNIKHLRKFKYQKKDDNETLAKKPTTVVSKSADSSIQHKSIKIISKDNSEADLNRLHIIFD